VSFDWGVIQQWKAEVVEKLRSGLAAQMKRFGVEVLTGRGEILLPPSGGRPGKVAVSPPASLEHDRKAGPGEYEAAAILVSTGSAPALPPIPGSRDNPQVRDSTGLLSVETPPRRLAIIGGGVIGVEFAGLFSALDSEVTVIEMMEEIVPFMDREQAPLLRRAMGGVDFKLGRRVEGIEGGRVHHTGKDGKTETTEADLILMAVGRRPALEGWGAKAAGIDLGPGVKVDDRMRTNIPGIWAAGDVTGRSLLAHSAYRMAEVAVADILESAGAPERPGLNRMRYNAIPWAVYGLTEAAGVGITEQEAAAGGIPIRKASLPMRASGRFAAENTFAGQGAVKVIVREDSGQILGIHAVGAYAPEFIWGGAALIEQEFRVADLRQLIFPHPTVCELIRDAAWEL
jgi:dihydrolipoamide dehydrogenase